MIKAEPQESFCSDQLVSEGCWPLAGPGRTQPYLTAHPKAVWIRLAYHQKTPMQD